MRRKSAKTCSRFSAIVSQHTSNWQLRPIPIPVVPRGSPEWFFWVSYFVAFLKGGDDELRAMATVARKNPLLEDIISHVEALALARAGRLQDARRLSAVSVEIAQRSG